MSSAPPYDYPWYTVVEGDELQQGDILEQCPIFILRTAEFDGSSGRAHFDCEQRPVILLSQSCDLVKGREKVEEVLLCALWHRSEFTAGQHIATSKGLEEARRGNLPAFHLLAPSTVPGFERELRIVDFRRVFTLPLDFFRQQLAQVPHQRLLPPYREHLSQAFARYFMRVGLPVDLPPFR
jgi:hypothetical protein